MRMYIYSRGNGPPRISPDSRMTSQETKTTTTGTNTYEKKASNATVQKRVIVPDQCQTMTIEMTKLLTCVRMCHMGRQRYEHDIGRKRPAEKAGQVREKGKVPRVSVGSEEARTKTSAHLQSGARLSK